ncbi:unnamed protein product [Lota lota]
MRLHFPIYLDVLCMSVFVCVFLWCVGVCVCVSLQANISSIPMESGTVGYLPGRGGRGGGGVQHLNIVCGAFVSPPLSKNLGRSSRVLSKQALLRSPLFAGVFAEFAEFVESVCVPARLSVPAEVSRSRQCASGS